jgi:hypothetical protein
MSMSSMKTSESISSRAFCALSAISAPGGDVAGNTTIQLSMLTDPSIIRCDDVKQEKCAPNPAAKALPTGNDETDPDGNLELVVSSASLENGEQNPRIDVLPQSALPHCPLKAKVWMLYELRTIKSGRRNLLEGLQQVELRQDEFSAETVNIVPADDIAPAVCSIKVTDARAKRPVTDDAPDLFAQLDKGSARKLAFTDYLTASELAHWLKTQMAAGTRGEPRLQKMTFHVDSRKTLTPSNMSRTTASLTPASNRNQIMPIAEMVPATLQKWRK